MALRLWHQSFCSYLDEGERCLRFRGACHHISCFWIAGLERGGSVTVLVVSLGAALLALFILAGLVGGLGEWISFYQMFVRKSAAMPYARIHQDGPWFRYLIDFLLLSPLVAVFALARLFRIDKQSRADLFWALFLGGSYVVMSVIPYGQSLRFAAYWDLPLRWLALSQMLDCGRISPVQSRAHGWLNHPRVCQRRSLPVLALLCLGGDLRSGFVSVIPRFGLRKINPLRSLLAYALLLTGA